VPTGQLVAGSVPRALASLDVMRMGAFATPVKPEQVTAIQSLSVERNCGGLKQGL
jgi:hypothetical protein